VDPGSGGGADQRLYDDEECVPVSALQHLLFCRRQCALIHVEGIWAENLATVEGKQLHERADSGVAESRGDVRIARRLAIRSRALGIAGYADVVEFHGRSGGTPGCVVPVEYKRGRPKVGDEDRVQLCAQALCLEEMLGREISRGALYYGKMRRRIDVAFDAALRRTTIVTAKALHALLRSGVTPPPEYGEKCAQCSLLGRCMPAPISRRRTAKAYCEEIFEAVIESDRGGEE